MPATPAWPPKSAPRLFVPPPLAQGGQCVLEGQQAHYLARVMRVAPGDVVILCDDQTGEWAARVVTAGKREIRSFFFGLVAPYPGWHGGSATANRLSLRNLICVH